MEINEKAREIIKEITKRDFQIKDINEDNITISAEYHNEKIVFRLSEIDFGNNQGILLSSVSEIDFGNNQGIHVSFVTSTENWQITLDYLEDFIKEAKEIQRLIFGKDNDE